MKIGTETKKTDDLKKERKQRHIEKKEKTKEN